MSIFSPNFRPDLKADSGIPQARTPQQQLSGSKKPSPPSATVSFNGSPSHKPCRRKHPLFPRIAIIAVVLFAAAMAGVYCYRHSGGNGKTASDSRPHQGVTARKPTTELRLEAENGDVMAQYKLGYMHTVEGVLKFKLPSEEINFHEAVKWLRKAACQKFVHAQFMLAMLYLNAGFYDEPVNSGQGYSWLLLASTETEEHYKESEARLLELDLPRFNSANVREITEQLGLKRFPKQIALAHALVKDSEP